MVYRLQNNVACAPENSVVSPVIRQSRSQTTSPRTRYKGAHGIDQHVRARPGRHARLRVRAVHDPGKLSWAAQRRVSTLKVPAAHLKTCPQSCVRGTMSQVHMPAAKPGRRVCASPGYRADRRVEGDRPDA